ncbi:yippee zinc-binding protein [Backusella circina FSU 941]|nr:yippee zinc-binding protein [Backusella circina FSU 941]
MGIVYNNYLDEYNNVYTCSKCSAHLSAPEMIISKSFTGSHGKAYLFDNVLSFSSPLHREMTTGRHLVSHIHCAHCDIQLGWKYLKAYNENQTYKEGKYILELNRIHLTNV